MTALPLLKMSVFLVGMTAVLVSSVAAILWRKASEVSVDFGPGAQSGLHAVQQDAQICALMVAYQKSADLNGRAARWSACAAFLFGVATFLSILPSG
ncbi:hypothetical protein [Rhodanobacter sp. 7MK24]|uniref:hypothetical protein n=1 Tax=Rhodanobacter sp. 7MK24 TaxID=2775922 RepID=UPI00177BAFD2|nr:hypothetical protein [Rhodanobacter sp. 7MK24]